MTGSRPLSATNRSRRRSDRSSPKSSRDRLDVIIDDGSHASFDQQMTFANSSRCWPRAAGISSRTWTGSRRARTPASITQTKHLLREIQQHGAARLGRSVGDQRARRRDCRDPVFRQPLRAAARKPARRPRGDPQARGVRFAPLSEPTAGEGRGLHDCLERSGACRALGGIGRRRRLSHRRRHRQHRRHRRMPDPRRGDRAPHRRPAVALRRRAQHGDGADPLGCRRVLHDGHGPVSWTRLAPEARGGVDARGRRRCFAASSTGRTSTIRHRCAAGRRRISITAGATASSGRCTRRCTTPARK